MTIDENVQKIKELVFKERKIVREMTSLFDYSEEADEEEKKMVNSQIERLKGIMKKISTDISEKLEVSFIEESPLGEENLQKIAEEEKPKWTIKKSKTELPELDKDVLKRILKKKEKVKEKKAKKASNYVKISNLLFSSSVKSLLKKKRLGKLQRDLVKSNLGYTSIGYISMLISTTIISLICAFFIFGFFMFFNISPDLPIITRITEDIATRFIKIFWILFVVPLGTFLFMYVYPSLERKSLEGKINYELPFATIHMAAISGSLIEPTKVFSIICSTKEYPNLEREFNKLLNEINVYGYDIVTALRDSSSNCPSTKLAELFNGLATTITSGGDLYDFFEKRAQTLLFEYRLDQEKRTKAAETFMDIYISVVIATPMILMLLLMMMRISGLGVSISTSMITLLIILAVSLINVFFLIFLQLKQPEGT